jgi:hypothetical protein
LGEKLIPSMNIFPNRDLDIGKQAALKIVHIRQQVNNVRLTKPQHKLMNQRVDRVWKNDLLAEMPPVDLRHPNFDNGANLVVGATKLLVRVSFTTGYMTGLTISDKKVDEEDGVYRVKR